MSENTPHNSHATGWIIGVVLAAVLYVGSAVPVLFSFSSRKWSLLPRSWEEPLNAFYMPATWLWDKPPLEKFEAKWFGLWVRILELHSPWMETRTEECHFPRRDGTFAVH